MRKALLGSLALAMLAACAPSASVKPDYGSVSGSVYRNQFFGFSIPIPGGFRAQDGEAVARELEAKRLELAASNPKLAAAVAESRKNTTVLLSLSPSMADPAEENQAILMIGAERLPAGHEVEDAKAYLEKTKDVLRGSGVAIADQAAARAETIGGVPFTAQEISVRTAAGPTLQSLRVALMRGYAFFISITYMSEKALAKSGEILKAAKF